MEHQPKVEWAETSRLIQLDLRTYGAWLPGLGSEWSLLRRVLYAVLWSEMFGAVLLFRLQTFLRGAGWPSLAWIATVLNRTVYLVSIGRDVRADGGLYIAHGHVVIDGKTTLGRNVSVGPFVTLGLNSTAFDFRGPTVGDDVLIGTGAKLLGPIRIGHRARIGANAVVVSDVPDDHTAVGVPARAQPSHASGASPSSDPPRVVSLRS